MHRLSFLGMNALVGLALGAIPTGSAAAQGGQASATGTVSVSATATTAAPAQKATPLPAKTLIDQAVATAKAEHKTVLVHFGATWCGWCRKFDQMLDSKDAGSILAKHFVIVGLDGMEEAAQKSAENPGTDSVIKSYGLAIGPPMYVFLDGDGKVLANSQVMPNNGGIGYPAVPAEFDAFDGLMKKTAPTMSDAERAQIRDYLVKNAPKEH